jgi:hypothetical protein
MPFEMTITRVQQGAGELALSGRIVEGAYFGPELVRVPNAAGEDVELWVSHHSMTGKLAWPVEPSHDVTLTLSVRPPRGLKVDTRRRVVGLGCVLMNTKRHDITDALADPRFWAVVLGRHLQSDEGEEEPEEAFFGLTHDVLTAYHEEVFHRRYHQGTWPFVRLPVDRTRSIELEFAASVERQQRFWVGVGEERTLCGYDSGHFSLPAFRLEEVAWLLEQPGFAPRAGALLLLSGCFVNEATAELRRLVTPLLEAVPGASRARVPEMAAAFVEGRVVDGLAWTRDPERGWVNNWVYSQRNPQSRLSVLGEGDFEIIDEFFGGGTAR